MDVLALPPAGIGAVVAALIAAVASFLGLVISKEQKTSEFRQDWIDALRDDVASLIAHANALHGAGIVWQSNPAHQFKTIRDDLVGINNATARIRLRLNPKEDASIAVLKAIQELETLFWSQAPVSPDKLNELEKRLVGCVNKVLKSEWDRVRRGEPTFRAAKVAAALAGMAALVLILLNLATHGLSAPQAKPAAPSAVKSG